MVSSKAPTVAAYLKELPAERRTELGAVRNVILAHLPDGYEEIMQYGMIVYVVPLSTYPQGYLGKKDVPLSYAALAAQKNFMSVYLMNIYSDTETEQWFQKASTASGKKLDMGKSCIRFKKAHDLPLDVIGQAIARTSVQEFIATYEASRKSRR